VVGDIAERTQISRFPFPFDIDGEHLQDNGFLVFAEQVELDFFIGFYCRMKQFVGKFFNLAAEKHLGRVVEILLGPVMIDDDDGIGIFFDDKAKLGLAFLQFHIKAGKDVGLFFYLAVLVEQIDEHHYFCPQYFRYHRGENVVYDPQRISV